MAINKDIAAQAMQDWNIKTNFGKGSSKEFRGTSTIYFYKSYKYKYVRKTKKNKF